MDLFLPINYRCIVASSALKLTMEQYPCPPGDRALLCLAVPRRYRPRPESPRCNSCCWVRHWRTERRTEGARKPLLRRRVAPARHETVAADDGALWCGPLRQREEIAPGRHGYCRLRATQSARASRACIFFCGLLRGPFRVHPREGLVAENNARGRNGGRLFAATVTFSG